ncbi:hypothetical protein CBC3_12320, partial [Clostridium botulinum V891]
TENLTVADEEGLIVPKEILGGRLEPGVEDPLTSKESGLKVNPLGIVSLKATFVIDLVALLFSIVMVYSIVSPIVAT